MEKIYKVTDSLKKVLDKTIMGIFLFSLVSFFVCVFVYAFRYPTIFRLYELGWIFGSIVLFFITVGLTRFCSKLPERFLIFVMCFVTIVFSIFLNISYQTKPVSDYAEIWKVANNIVAGNYVWMNDPGHYISVYPWQFGTSFFESFIVRLFGSNFDVLKVLNTMLMCLINYLIFYSCTKKTNYKIAVFAYIMSAFFVPYVFTMPQFTNHHLALPLLLISLNLFDDEKKRKWALCGVLIAIMNFIRPYGIIVTLTIFCICSFQIMKTKDVRKYFFLFCSFLIPYLAVQKTIDYTLIAQGYIAQPVSEASVPYFKFQKGLYWYDSPFDDLKSFNYNYEAYNEAQGLELKEKILKHPADVIVYVLNKMVRYLGFFDYQFEMTYNHDVSFYYRYPVRAFYCIGWFQYIIYICLAFCGFFYVFKEKSLDVWKIFFIGNTFVYLFIEAFTSYRFESYPFIIICASTGFEVLNNKWVAVKKDLSRK